MSEKAAACANNQPPERLFSLRGRVNTVRSQSSALPK